MNIPDDIKAVVRAAKHEYNHLGEECFPKETRKAVKALSPPESLKLIEEA